MENKGVIIEKRLEFLLGVIFLIPPVTSIVAFVMLALGDDTYFSSLKFLTDNWTCGYIVKTIGGGNGYNNIIDGIGGMSAAPIYFGIMAIVGAYLIKNSFRYFFKK